MTNTNQKIFKLSIREEGYHSNQFTPRTQTRKYFIVGGGCKAAVELVEKYLWSIVSPIVNDFEPLSDELIATAIHNAENPHDMGWIEESNFSKFNADVAFHLHIGHSETVTLTKEDNDTPQMMNPTKREFLKAAKDLDNRPMGR